MISKKKNAILYLLIFINIMLVVKVFSYSNEFSKIYNKHFRLRKSFYELGGAGELVNRTEHLYKNIILKDTSNYPLINQYSIIAIFTNHSCLTCIEMEIEYLSDLYAQFPQNIRIYAQTKTVYDLLVKKSNIKIFNISNEQLNSFYENINSTTSLIFMLDKKGKVFSIHKPEINGIMKSRVFYSKINNLFASLGYKK